MSHFPKLPIILLIKRDIMIARDNNLELGVRAFEHLEHGLVLGEATGHGDVAGVEEDVGGREGEAVGVGGVGKGERRVRVGVGDEAEAGFDGFWGVGHLDVVALWENVTVTRGLDWKDFETGVAAKSLVCQSGR